MIELGNKFDLVPLSHALRVGQWDKAPKSGTACGTSAGQASLKSLAIKVLKRDKPWDNSGTRPGQRVGQDTPFCPTSCPTQNERNRQFSEREISSSPPGGGPHVFPARGKPNPWPVLWHLVESFNCNPLVMDQWPASVVLCFAPGVLASEKRAALRYAVDNWQALLADMALPANGSIRHCWIEGFEFYCRPGNVKEAVIC